MDFGKFFNTEKIDKSLLDRVFNNLTTEKKIQSISLLLTYLDDEKFMDEKLKIQEEIDKMYQKLK